MRYSSTRSMLWLRWAHETFGDIALDRGERSRRFLEEAIELAQSLNVERAVVDGIVARVYSRPAGDAPREFGQALSTLEILADVADVDAAGEADRELDRVRSVSVEEWAKRHGAKVALGIAKWGDDR